ncbi:RidA family protein [Thalassotalea ganghwensis]
MATIERIAGIYQGRSTSSAYQDLVWTVATAGDTTLDIVGQTKATLTTIENNLLALGSDKHDIVSAQVYIVNIDEKPLMDAIFCQWLGDGPQHWLKKGLFRCLA